MPARGESKKPRGGPKPALLRLALRHGRLALCHGELDPATDRLDLQLFQSDLRHFQADRAQLRSAERRGGPETVRVRLNQRGVGLEMSAVESDARGVRFATPLFRSDVSQIESDELRVGLKMLHF